MGRPRKRKLKDRSVVPPPEPAPAPASVAVATTTELPPDDLRKIIEPFTHEQLVQIVQTASLRHLDVLDAVRSIADGLSVQRRLYVRGLDSETTSKTLRTVFSTYGDLEGASVVTDKTTRKSRGYGFVTYKHIDGALMALKEPSKKIDGRMTVTRVSSAGNGITGGVTVTLMSSQTLDTSSRKIYVGNVPNDMPGERLLEHFSSYGEIEEGPIVFNKDTGNSKGFAFFVYKNVEGARASLIDPIKTIDGHQLNCKWSKRGLPDVQPVVAPPDGGVKPKGNVDSHKQQWMNLNKEGSMQGPSALQYGGTSAYGGNLGGYGLSGQGPPSLGGGGGGLGLSSIGSQEQSSLCGGIGGFSSRLGGGGGPYGGSQFGGIGANYGGLSSGGGAWLGSDGTDFGGSSRGSLYGLSSGSGRMSSGSFPESDHYSFSAGSAYKNQTPITRVPYQGPPYF